MIDKVRELWNKYYYYLHLFVFFIFFFLEFNLFICMQWNSLSRDQNKKSILCTSIIVLFHNSLTLSIIDDTSLLILK
jgi:hypothetical membrane protein